MILADLLRLSSKNDQVFNHRLQIVDIGIAIGVLVLDGVLKTADGDRKSVV